MNNRKKRRKIIIGLICILGIFILAFYLEKLEEKKQGKFVEQLISYDKFAHDGNIDSQEPPTKAPSSDYSGNDISLLNRQEFISSISELDSALTIINATSSGVKYLDIILKDCNDDNSKDYYEHNKEVLLVEFGINSYKDFISIYEMLKPMKFIKNYTIDISNLDITGDIYRFNLTLEGECEEVIPVKVQVKDSYKMEYTAFWGE